MAKSQTYWSDLKAAKEGETIAMNYFKSLDYEIEDVSDNSNYWSQDIDFIAHKGDRHIAIEVKYDGNIHYTNNILLEIQNVTSGYDGWAIFSKAEFITIVSRETHAIYIARLEDLREFMSTNYCRTVFNIDADGSKYKSKLVSIKDFINAGYTMEIINGGY